MRSVLDGEAQGRQAVAHGVGRGGRPSGSEPDNRKDPLPRERVVRLFNQALLNRLTNLFD